MPQQQRAYREEINRIWKAQVAALSASEAPSVSAEEAAQYEGNTIRQSIPPAFLSPSPLCIRRRQADGTVTQVFLEDKRVIGAYLQARRKRDAEESLLRRRPRFRLSLAPSKAPVVPQIRMSVPKRDDLIESRPRDRFQIRLKAPSRTPLRKRMLQACQLLFDVENSWPFHRPVQEQYAPDYYTVVERGTCLEDLRRLVKEGDISTAEDFIAEVTLLYENCLSYNGPFAPITHTAKSLLTLAKKCFPVSPSDDDDAFSPAPPVGTLDEDVEIL